MEINPESLEIAKITVRICSYLEQLERTCADNMAALMLKSVHEDFHRFVNISANMIEALSEIKFPSEN